MAGSSMLARGTLKVLLDAAGITLNAALLDGLRTMERVALQVWREEREDWSNVVSATHTSQATRTQA